MQCSDAQMAHGGALSARARAHLCSGTASRGVLLGAETAHVSHRSNVISPTCCDRYHLYISAPRPLNFYFTPLQTRPAQCGAFIHYARITRALCACAESIMRADFVRLCRLGCLTVPLVSGVMSIVPSTRLRRRDSSARNIRV